MILNIDDTVFVPISVDIKLSRHPFAFYKSRVIEKKLDGRSVKINLPDGDSSEWIGTSKVHRNSGILIFTIGDYFTETALLDPLSKSMLQFCRLLLNDDYVRLIKVRSIDEFEYFWDKENLAYKYIILIGHGDKQALNFAVNNWIETEDVFQLLNNRAIQTEKIFISLCCKTGYRQFAGKLSTLPYCESFIAPLHDINGAIASQFCQSFLNHHLLHGHTTKIAFKKTEAGLNNKNVFRLWKNGKLEPQ